MATKKRLDKTKVVATLEISTEDMDKADDLTMEQMSLARSMLKLADINQEKEYLLCRALAEKLLGKVPEPEELDTE